jgi:hypothetical protein
MIHGDDDRNVRFQQTTDLVQKQTVAVAKVSADQIRPLAQNEIHHAGALDSVAI